MNPAAWYQDPTGRHEYRWWDGTAWTDHVSDAGTMSSDPYVVAEAPTIAMPATPAPGTEPPTAPPQPAPAAPLVIAPTPRRVQSPLVIGGAVASVVILLLVVLLVRGGDDEASVVPDSVAPTTTIDPAGDTTIAPATTDGAPATTDGVAVAPTTDAPATTVAPSTSSTTTTTTVAPESPWPTSQELAAVLPRADALLPDLEAPGYGPFLDPTPGSGPWIGWCGGYDDAAQADRYGAAAMATSDRYYGRPGGWFQVSVISFREGVAASQFLSSTGELALSCEGGIDYRVPEGSGRGEYDGFTGSYGTDTIWDFYEVGAAEYVDVPGTVNALLLRMNAAYEATVEGVDYRGAFLDVVQYEQVGLHVIVWRLRAECCIAGFTDREPGYGYPLGDALPDMRELADRLRPDVLAGLRSL